MFPDGKTVAFVERWNGADGISENAQIGDTVELYGEDMVVLEKGYEDAKVVREDQIQRRPYFDEIVEDWKTDEKERLREDWEYERENYAEEFIDKALESEKFHKFKEGIESDLDNLEIIKKFEDFDKNEYEKVKDEVIEEEVERRAKDWNNALNLSEYLNSEFGQNTEVYYKSSYG